MMTGTQYLESLRDGRKVWIMGEGWIDDITRHPTTQGTVQEYSAWYDRHSDPDWQDRLLSHDKRTPISLEIPRTSADLIALGTAIYEQAFVSAGHITHTPCYGALIALGILDTVEILKKSGEANLPAAQAFLQDVQRNGTYVTLTHNVSVLGDRFRADEEKLGLRIVGETDAGLIVNGRTGMHTSAPYAHEIYINLQSDPSQRAMFAVRVNSPGVRVIARSTAARTQDAFARHLIGKYDELDAQVWLENVLIPWEKVFALGFDGPSPEENRTRDRIFSWLTWHHLNSFLAHADFTLGLALATCDSFGLQQSAYRLAQIVDMIIDASTIRSCLSAANHEPETSPSGYIYPKPIHVATGTIYTLKVRQKMSEILRDIPGSSLVIRPTSSDFEDPDMAAALEEGFGGGGYSGKQRAALLNLVWDHVSSSLDGRESAFEMHASGGMERWRTRVQRWFDRYDLLANKVLQAVDIEMPTVEIEKLRDLMASPPSSGSTQTRS